MKKIIEILKAAFKITFNLNFTTSKLLGYIVVFSGLYLTALIKSETIWIWSILGATALFGVKVASDYSKKDDQK